MSTFWTEVLARPREVFGRLSRGQRVGVAALLGVGLVIAGLSSILAGRESYTLLYGGLDPQSASEIASQLSSSGVAYRINAEGNAITVPEQRVNEVRMQLAAAGVPKAGVHDFSIFDQNQFGMTDQLFNVNMQRALAGVLEKTIETIDRVQKAHVLVTMQPPGAIRFKDSPRPTASVMLQMRPGGPLVESSVAAIASLVASSVGGGMRAEDVVIVDSNAGRQLNPRGDSNDPMASAEYLRKVQGIEQSKQEKAESMLRVAIGDGKASVRVNVELDPKYQEKLKETLSDENRATLRESKSSESTGKQARGGDTSNTAAAKSKEEDGGPHHTEDETEFGHGSERSLEIMSAGSILHMSVSLLLDDSDPTLKEKSEKLGEIVKNAVGFSEKRKDTFAILPIPFAKAPAIPPMPGPFAVENLLPLAGHLTEAATVLFVLFLLVKIVRGGGAGGVVVKGKAKAAAGGGSAASEGATEENEYTELTYAADGKSGDLRTRLNTFVTKHPEQAREVLLAWLKEEMTN
jgi:flagellar M-ring protein FliF